MSFLRSLGACTLACALLAACTKVGTTGEGPGGPAGGRHAWTKPGTLRVGIQTAPNTLNPVLAANTTESMINRLMFDGLVTVDASGKNQIPVLAETVPTLANGGISSDGLTLTYHLRKNVRWHDGAPFSSKDVKFSWQAIMNPNNNVISQSGYKLVRAVDTPDADTVVFHMKQRFSPAVDTLFGESDDPFEVVPEHILGKLKNLNTAPFNSAPIGTGPFKFKEWVRGDHLTFVPNDDYFLGKPKLTQIVIRPIPDENTEVNLLRTHDIDWQFEASPQEYKDVKHLADVVPYLQDKNEIERIEINTKHPPLDDVRVRRAIVYALDREKLVGALTFGSAAAADQDLPPFMWAHAKDVARYPYEPAKARALLAEAGFRTGPDGILVRGGQRLSLQLATNSSNATRRAGAVQLQSMMRAVGIEISIKTYLGSLLFATMGQNGILQNGNFDLAWTGWISGVDPDQSSIFTCKAQPPNGNNEMRYCSAKMDAAQETALTSFDRPSRIEAYERIEALVTSDVPLVPVWWPRMLQPVNPDFRHFEPNPVTESWNAYQWDI